MRMRRKAWLNCFWQASLAFCKAVALISISVSGVIEEMVMTRRARDSSK